MLQEKGADLNICNNEGKTPIYLASENGQYAAVKKLTELGADVNIPEKNGRTPFYIAVLKAK